MDLKTVNIKGKQYVTVNERLKYFREHFAGYSLTSEITHLNENGVIVRASLKNNEGDEVASGYAHEKQNSSFINKTSFIKAIFKSLCIFSITLAVSALLIFLE